MKKALGVVVGVIVVAGVAWVGGAWYTGKRVEEYVRQGVDEANAKIHAVLPSVKMDLSVASLDRHLFSSDIRYSLKIEGIPADQGQPVRDAEFLLDDHVDHGPFPLGRLKSGQWAPAMATSSFVLVSNATVKPWFDLTKDVVPLSGSASISYQRDVDGVLTLQPIEVTRDEGTFKFSGMGLNISSKRSDQSAKVTGAIDTLGFTVKDPEAPAQFDLSGLTLASDMHQGQSGLQIGTNQLAIKKIGISADKTPPIQLTGYSQNAEITEDANGLSARGLYDVAMVNYGGKDVAGVRIGFGARNMAVDAVKSLAEIYGKVLSRTLKQGPGADRAEAYDLSPPEREQLIKAAEALLAGNPTLFIDPVVVKNAKGESRFNLNLDLASPGPIGQPVDELIAKFIRKLDAKLTLSQPMVASILSQVMQIQGIDVAIADKQADAEAQTIGKLAVASGYASLQGDDVVATLGYADKVVDLNGKKMPLQEFAGMVMGAAMGMGGDTPDMGEPDADEPDQDEGTEPEEDDAPDAAAAAAAPKAPPAAPAKPRGK